jgi:hypothetical protein
MNEEEVITQQLAEEVALPLGQYYITKGKSFYKFVRGIEVEIEQVSPTLLVEIQTSKPAPRPPVKTFDRGDGSMVTEENKADPDYNYANILWTLDIEATYALLLIKLGVKTKVDHEKVQRVRDMMKTLRGIELDPDDLFVYVKYCLPSNEKEYNHFLGCLAGRSAPMKGAIAQAIENFSDNVQTPAFNLGTRNGAG